MTSVAAPAGDRPVPAEQHQVARLKADAIGPLGLAALVVGVTSPAIGLYALWGPIEAAAGPVAPLVFLAALVITLPTVLLLRQPQSPCALGGRGRGLAVVDRGARPSACSPGW